MIHLPMRRELFSSGMKLVFHEVLGVSRSLAFVSRVLCGCLIPSDTDYFMLVAVGEIKFSKNLKDSDKLILLVRKYSKIIGYFVGYI